MNSKVTFQSLNRPKLVDDVVIQLQKKISSGDIRQGDKIPTEPELMEQFGVGRSTIREAVRVLVHAGLLEKKQGFGTYLTSNSVIQEPLVHRLRRAEILEVYEVRKMLELEISRLAASRRDEDDLEKMRSHLDNRSAALDRGDTEAYLLSDIDFHLSVAVASKNSVVIDLYRTFSTVLLDAIQKLAKYQVGHDPHTLFHERLYQSIQEKDVQAAVHWTSQNLDGTIAELQRYLGME
ncbi:FadR family transcriptional regulator [Paenibacillus sp. WQ 127069]|jgi:GntR family transcriptional repressor for pyruvate dehydrogenase complex|uniref:FadR family transcriptional regulator n=1 Tax=Paenibacillus baimaensis TaxID=2982185 RepID=A0ABT2USU6_9BACL|nr:FadR/GntR family transcriptional regulator [Paenibacillus sp. WQ 127069]MCU6797748.1 FadR family transcriptional regulator [Paenibacillus sp. WQ 127069]